MGFFSRTPKVAASTSPSGGNPPTRTASPKVSKFDEAIIEAGQNIRIAVEKQDTVAAARAFQNLETARAKSKGYPTSDGFTMFGADVIAEAFNFVEVTDVGLTADRVHEMRICLALAVATGVRNDDLVTSALLGVETPTLWPGFIEEREFWRASSQAHGAWSDLLRSEAPRAWTPDALQGLSLDARQLLTMPKLIKRMQVVSRDHLAKRTLLPYNRIDAAILELRATGLAVDPTLADRLSMATAVQLKELHAGLSLDGKGTKAKLVATLIEMSGEGDQSQLQKLANQVSPTAPGDISLGMVAGKDAEYFFAFSAVMGDWLGKTLHRSAAVKGLVAAKGWEVMIDGDCPKCLKAPKKVSKKNAQNLPPFHIGCMCLELPNI